MISEPNSVNALHNPVSRTVHIRSGGERKKKREREAPTSLYVTHRTTKTKLKLGSSRHWSPTSSYSNHFNSGFFIPWPLTRFLTKAARTILLSYMWKTSERKLKDLLKMQWPTDTKPSTCDVHKKPTVSSGEKAGLCNWRVNQPGCIVRIHAPLLRLNGRNPHILYMFPSLHSMIVQHLVN